MSRVRRSPIGRRALIGALALSAAVPAVADAAISQHSDFRLAGGTRYTLTLSKAQQLPGVDPAIWPKGYRYVCKATGPVMRYRVSFWGTSDTAELNTYLGYAKPGALVYSRLGSGPHWALDNSADGRPRTSETFPLGNIAVSFANPAKAPVAPLLGLYNLQLVPYSSFGSAGWSVYLPVTTLNAKLDVRQGTDAECPTPTEKPWEFYRASR